MLSSAQRFSLDLCGKKLDSVRITYALLMMCVLYRTGNSGDAFSGRHVQAQVTSISQVHFIPWASFAFDYSRVSLSDQK